MLVNDAPIETLITTLDQRIPKWMARENVPGLSVALIQDAQVVWRRGYGFKDKATKESVMPGTVFQAASLSKPVFAYAVLKWCDAGGIDLDTSLSVYLAVPYTSGDPRLQQITARNVLSHTPGFPNWRPKDQPLRIHFAPGERFAYSGEGYVYLQRVVERITGQRLDEWMQAQVLGPLGMRHSSYVWRDAYETQAARGHDDQGRPQEHNRMTEPNAAYSLYTTPSEFARFVAALLEPRRDPACRSPIWVARMLVSQIPVNDAGLDAKRPASEIKASKNVSWGLGWGLEHTPGKEAFWHWGDNGQFQAFVMGFPRSRSGMVCMANSEQGRALWSDLFGTVFGSARPALSWLMGLYGGQKATPIMTIEEAATYLRVHPLTARRFAREGVLPAFKVGRQWRIKRALLDEWLKERSLHNLIDLDG
jgi:excisionase family DNA binding protein